MTITRRRPLWAVLGLVAALALAIPLLGSPKAGAADSTVYVVHGIPGVDVDVYAGGQLLLPGFTPGTVSPGVQVAAGDVQVQVFAATPNPPQAASARTDSPVIDQTLTVPSGASVSVVANIESGTPALQAFVNDLSPVPDGSSRVIVRHTAQAPTVDIAVNGQVALPGLAPGQEAAAVLPAGTYDVAVQAGGQTVLDLPGTVIPAGKDVIVYAVGSATAEPSTLTTVTQVLDVPTEAPTTTAAPAPAPAPAPAAPVAAAPAMTG